MVIKVTLLSEFPESCSFCLKCRYPAGSFQLPLVDGGRAFKLQGLRVQRGGFSK